jgi:hypothetical protein
LSEGLAASQEGTIEMATRTADPVLKELDGIKRLLILGLLTSGVQATDVARALGVDKSAVSRLVPARRIRKRSQGGTE